MNDNKTEARTIMTTHSWSDSEHSYTLESYSDGDVYLTVDNYYYYNGDINPQSFRLCEKGIDWQANQAQLEIAPLNFYSAKLGLYSIDFTHLAEAENFITKVNNLLKEIQNSIVKPKIGVIHEIGNTYQFKIHDDLTIKVETTPQSKCYALLSLPNEYYTNHTNFDINRGFVLWETVAESPNNYDTDSSEKEYKIEWLSYHSDDIDYYFPSSEEEAIMIYNCLNEIANKLKEKPQ